MRFDTPIYFQRMDAGAYDANTGNYECDNPTEDKRYASVTNTGTETLKLVYGDLRQSSLTVRLQTPYKHPFDRIRIGEGDTAKFYHVDMVRRLRSKQTFVVSEVQ